MTEKNWGDLGDTAAIERIMADTGQRDEGPEPGDAYDEMNRRQEQGGGSWPFDPVIAENAMIWCGIGFSAAAKKRGSHWAVSQEDARRLGVSLAQVVHRYMPDFENVGPVGNLAIVGVGLVGPRMMLDAMNRPPKNQQDTGGEHEPH
ncbi:MAG: hypothetical protein WED11_04905 [Natronospirillum sp.]